MGRSAFSSSSLGGLSVVVVVVVVVLVVVLVVVGGSVIVVSVAGRSVVEVVIGGTSVVSLGSEMIGGNVDTVVMGSVNSGGMVVMLASVVIGGMVVIEVSGIVSFLVDSVVGVISGRVKLVTFCVGSGVVEVLTGSTSVVLGVVGMFSSVVPSLKSVPFIGLSVVKFNCSIFDSVVVVTFSSLPEASVVFDSAASVKLYANVVPTSGVSVVSFIPVIFI